MIKEDLINTYKTCGSGVIIKKDFILSAAHIMIEKSGQLKHRWYEVVIGTTDLNSNTGKAVQVDKIFISEDYNPISYDHDISVIKLNSSLELTEKAFLSKLNWASFELSYDGYKATLTGFGYTRIVVKLAWNWDLRTNGSSENQLKYISVRVLNNADCKDLGHNVPDSQMCGQSIPRSEGQEWGACIGDSGGPLVYDNKIIGILSRVRHDCVDTVRPSMYSRVSTNAPFIQSVVDGELPQNTHIYTNPLLSKSSCCILK